MLRNARILIFLNNAGYFYRYAFRLLLVEHLRGPLISNSTSSPFYIWFGPLINVLIFIDTFIYLNIHKFFDIFKCRCQRMSDALRGSGIIILPVQLNKYNNYYHKTYIAYNGIKPYMSCLEKDDSYRIPTFLLDLKYLAQYIYLHSLKLN